MIKLINEYKKTTNMKRTKMDTLFRNEYYDILFEIFRYLEYLEIRNICIINKEINKFSKNKNQLVDQLINKKKEENIRDAEQDIKKLLSIKSHFSSSGDIECYNHLLNQVLLHGDSRMIDILLEMESSDLMDVDKAIKRIKTGYRRRKTLYRKNNVTFPIYGKILYWAVNENKLDIIKKLEKDPRVDINYESGEILYAAIKNSNIKAIKLLLNNFNKYKKTTIKRALIKAVEINNTEIINLLLECDKLEFYQGDEAIIEAIRIGNVNIFNMLIKRPEINPGAQDNQAIISASYTGNLEMVNRLLEDPRVNPCARNNLAIEFASIGKHIDIMRRLLEDLRVRNTLGANNYIKYMKQIN